MRDLSQTAEHVRATGDLSQRIEVHGQDELSRLAATFNAMLESLDEAQQRQRQLVQDASHELRTPLTSLRTNIELLASRAASCRRTTARQLLQDVVAQLGEMTDLITELTELARGEEQQTALEEVRLDLLTEGAIRRAMRNHPDVPFEADLAPWTVVGTPANLERAIANLLDNAAKWSPAGRAGRGRAARRRADGARPRAGHRRGRPPARLRALLPRDVGARACPARASGSRSCSRWPSCTAAGSRSRTRPAAAR